LRVLLDTTVLIDALRGGPAAERVRGLREQGHVPWISPINIEEVLRGARESEEPVMLRFLEGMRLVELGQKEGVRAGRWRREHTREGVTLSQSDCLIAAAAIGIGARLATGNPKHLPMDGLDVEHWPVGE
jgi:predicted nucleic acid-binding protein